MADHSMLESELDEQSGKLTNMRRKASQIREQLQIVAEEVDHLNGLLGTVRQQQAELAVESKKLEDEAEKWAGEFHFSMRKRSGGMEFPEVTVKGVTYKNVVLQPITGPIVTFGHTGGIAHVSYEDLPPELHTLFGPMEEMEGSFVSIMEPELWAAPRKLPERPVNWNVDYRKLKQDNDRAMRFFAKQQMSRSNRCPFR